MAAISKPELVQQ